MTRWLKALRVRAASAQRRLAGRFGAGAASSDTSSLRVQDRSQALKRATFFLLSLAAIALSARAIVGERGLLDAHRAARDLETLRGETAKWHARNAYLEKRIKALREDPATIEAIARERLDWVRPGEITFLFPHDPAELEPDDPGPVAPGEFQSASADDLAPAETEPPPAPPKR